LHTRPGRVGAGRAPASHYDGRAGDQRGRIGRLVAGETGPRLLPAELGRTCLAPTQPESADRAREARRATVPAEPGDGCRAQSERRGTARYWPYVMGTSVAAGLFVITQITDAANGHWAVQVGAGSAAALHSFIGFGGGRRLAQRAGLESDIPVAPLLRSAGTVVSTRVATRRTGRQVSWRDPSPYTSPAVAPPRPGGPGTRGVVVDLRAPQQLVIGLPEGALETPLGPREGLLGASRWQRAAKRLMDVTIGALLLAVLSPILICAALMVKLSSRGPVFFAQERIGCRGRTFRFLKFRTMRNGAHDERYKLADLNELDGPVFKIRDDPRITRAGRILRKLSVDEFPQFFHVLSGKMSLVGPRPPLREEVKAYSQWDAQRLLVKPGLTCIWQVSGRSDLDFHTWVGLDIEYIRRWSLWLDLKLLARTVPAVLSGRGAY
jgi:lipopolysaccharide/colanic/teichoic acid biosynthesis glycosyltransferase